MIVALRYLFALLALMGAFVLSLGTARAQSPVTHTDTAANAPYDNGWQTGDNGGSGFGPWTLTTTNPANAGAFVGSSNNNGNTTGNIDTAGRSWGLYANSGATAEATRDITAFPFGVGDVFAISMDNGFIIDGGSVGFDLRSTTGTTLFSFYFLGGTTSYRIFDASGVFDTGIPITYNGLRVTFTLTSATTYDVTIAVNGGSTTTFTNRQLPAGTVGRLRLFNANAGSGSARDAFFNSLTLVNNPPLAVVLSDFSATGTEAGVALTWETVSETDMLGFNLLRATSADGTPERINPELIPAAGGSAGGLYEYEDSTAEAGTLYFYWLDAVETTGATERFGPVSARAGVPTAVTLGGAGAAPAPTMPLLALAGVAALGALALLRRRA